MPRKKVERKKPSLNFQTNPLRGKVQLVKKHYMDPNFFNRLYSVQPTNGNNTLTVNYKDFFRNIEDRKEKPNLNNFYFCKIHNVHLLTDAEINTELREVNGIVIWKSCVDVIQFRKFNKAFNIETPLNDIQTLPPPSEYRDKNLQFFSSILTSFQSQHFLKILKAQKINRFMTAGNLDQFRKDSFSGGTLKDMTSGKTSEIRNKVLATKVNGRRFTVTLDPSLPPNRACVNRKIFQQIRSCCGTYFVNRAPSINSSSIYPIQLGTHDDENDETIHMNACVIQGLHMDQDGDEITLMWLEYLHPLLGLGKEIQMAIREIQKISYLNYPVQPTTQTWRYEMPMLFWLYAEIYNDVLCEASTLWRFIPGTPKEKMKHFNLLCGSASLRNETNDVINMFLKINEKQCLGLQLKELKPDQYFLPSIVKSGAKGTEMHLKKLYSQLYNVNEVDDGINHFNMFITASSTMSTQGTNCFHSLFACQSLHLYHSSILYNGRTLLTDLATSQLGTPMFANKHAIKFLVLRFVEDFEFENTAL